MQYFPVARCQLRTPHLPGQLPDPTKVNSAKKHVTHQALRKLIIFNALNQETSIEFCAGWDQFWSLKMRGSTLILHTENQTKSRL